MRKTNKHLIATLSVVIALVVVLCMSLIACDHTHNYSKQGKDKDYHWNYCPDDEVVDEASKEAHKDENSDGKCDVCGYEMAASDPSGDPSDPSGTPETPHIHNYSAQGKDSNKHWNYCPDDNAVEESSEADHVDDDVDGYCDVCNYEMGIVSEECVKVELVDGVPTLIVKGNIPEVQLDGEPVRPACVKLHANVETENFYWDDVCSHKWGFEFQVALTDLSYEETPWYWFHLYFYQDENPEEDAQKIHSCDLPRGDLLTVGQSIDYDSIRYTIKAWSDGEEIGTGLVIEATLHYELNVSEINIDTGNGLELIVKGTVSDGVKSLRLHANGNGSDEWFGAPVLVNDGQFEAKFDLTQLKVEDTPWCWFHIYLSKGDNVEEFKRDGKHDLQRGSLVADDVSVVYSDIRYSVVNSQQQLVIQPTPMPKYSVTDVKIDNTDGLKLVVTGTLSDNQRYLVIHADGNDAHYYGEKAVINDNAFTAEFDLTKLYVHDTPWCWFHIYTYEEENPAELSTGFNKDNLMRENYFSAGDSVSYKDITYTIQNQDQITIQPTSNIKDSTTIEFDVTGDVPVLVVKGMLPSAYADAKIHAYMDGDIYGESNISVEEGRFECRFDITQLEVKENTPWAWFHIYLYDAAGNKVGEFDLKRPDTVPVGYSYDHNGVRYTVQDNSQFVLNAVEITAE